VAHGNFEKLVEVRRSVIVDHASHREQVAAGAGNTFRIGQANGAPVFGDADVEVGQVVAVEDDVLRVDFGSAHA
jgi:hypothetical protein